MTGLIISPKTKVAELLQAYPHLEGTLVGYLPAFEKLRNPVLRRTVARITTLQQAAAVGRVKVEDLVNRLRREVGQETFGSFAAGGYTTERPGWFSEDRVVAGLDARGMLEAGEQPVHQLLADLRRLGSGEIYRLAAPFLPAPLIDKAQGLGIAHWVTQGEGEEVVVYFRRA